MVIIFYFFPLAFRIARKTRVSRYPTMSNGKGGKSFNTDELRKFYFSKAANFTSFNKSSTVHRDNDAASLSQVDLSVNETAASRILPSPVHASTPPSVLPSNATATTPAVVDKKASPEAVVKKSSAAGSAVALAKANNAANNTTNATSQSVNGDSVSPAYIAFLRQQQDLVKSHCSIDEIIQKFLEVTSERHSHHLEGVQGADNLLRMAEDSTDWNWKSKFNDDALCQDAGLTVPVPLLKKAEDIPNVTDLQYQQQQLVKLKQAFISDKNSHTAEFKLVLENGIRRMDRLVKEYSASQLDATPVVRVSDNLLVQLDHILAQAPLEVILRDVNDSLIALSQKQKECMSVRDQAHEDGEMNVAESETYRLADISEELADAQVEKIRILMKALEENVVSSSVRDTYTNQALQDSAAIEAESVDLKHRCEADLARLYQLKKQVDEAESVMLERTALERASSDVRLKNIASRQQEAWEQIAMLIKQIRQLETERHAEVKKRVEEKVKDEARKNEFVAFMNVANAKAIDYDRTIKNCDTNIHCSKLMSEFLQSGFYTIQKTLTSRNEAITNALLDARKGHLEVFRSLLFTLGDLAYKKERKIEEVGEQIQAAHIQQEMCSDSLNPNAKKFSDLKKELLRLRDEIELEIRDIRDRQSVALERYNPTDKALNDANVPHSHPMADLEERQLNMRAKMVGYKAMALGHVSSVPLKNELETLKQSLDESRRVISRSANRSLTMQL